MIVIDSWFSGTYNLDDSGKRAMGPAYQSSFKSTSKRDAFASQGAVEVMLLYLKSRLFISWLFGYLF